MNDWSVVLYRSINNGSGSLGNITDRIKDTWRRSTRAVGGYWWGTCEYAGASGELLEMFLEGMMREFRENSGGLITWQGFVAEMELQLNGVRYMRSMLNMANAVKCIYTRIGDSILTNGGAESGAWSAYNGATVTQSTTWVNTGTYSCKIDVGDATIRGATLRARRMRYHRSGHAIRD
jgi:hypothetical protein